MDLLTKEFLNKVKMPKRPPIAQEIVFLDGLTGSGKTMMGPVLGSFERVELGRVEHVYEYFCTLHDLGKIDAEAASFMINMYADLAIYDSMISRETNFRWSDLSGVFRNPKTFEYIKRLFVKDGSVVLDRIKETKPILHIITHQALGVMRLAFQAYGERVKAVEMVRHPLYLLEHWYSYIDRHGTDSRDFTVWIEHKGQSLPWFAQGWEEKYARSNSMDRVIYSIEWLTKKKERTLEALNTEERKRVLIIPFEKFVLNPEPHIDQTGTLLNTKPTRETESVLRKQKCPRAQVAAGPSKEIYKKYGWKKPDPNATEQEELQKKRDFAKETASEAAMKTLDEISKRYEDQYGLWF